MASFLRIAGLFDENHRSQGWLVLVHEGTVRFNRVEDIVRDGGVEIRWKGIEGKETGEKVVRSKLRTRVCWLSRGHTKATRLACSIKRGWVRIAMSTSEKDPWNGCTTNIILWLLYRRECLLYFGSGPSEVCLFLRGVFGSTLCFGAGQISWRKINVTCSNLINVLIATETRVSRWFVSFYIVSNDFISNNDAHFDIFWMDNLDISCHGFIVFYGIKFQSRTTYVIIAICSIE